MASIPPKEPTLHERLFRAVAHCADPIALIDREGVITFVSDSIERLTGFPAADRIGRDAFELVHPDDRQRVREAWLETLAHPGEVIAIEYRARHRDGTWREREVVGVNRLHEPALRAVVINYHDTTARRRTENALQDSERLRLRLEQDLRQAQKMQAIGRLAGGIAHDFNNLLTAISAYAELALEQLPDLSHEQVRKDIEEIRSACRTAASLTRQLLAFSQRQVLQPNVINLNTVVARTHGLLRRLIGEHINIVWRLAAPIDRVNVDAGQVEQVILNLALNARDAMPDGGTLTIETDNFFADAGPQVMLAIADTGKGIHDSAREHLFEPYYTTKPSGEGTGLGLATVYGIVTQSGGSISVDSEPERGTTFKVFLPSIGSARVSDEEVGREMSMPRGSETILLAEDDREVRSVASETLRRHGYNVIEAPNATAAMAAARQQPFDLLVTDVVMPGMSGVDLATQFSQLWPQAAVLFMSGYPRSAAVDVTPKSSLIQKPFSADVLLRTVRELFDGKR